MQTNQQNTRSGIRTHANNSSLNLKFNALTTRPSWFDAILVIIFLKNVPSSLNLDVVDEFTQIIVY